MNQVRADHEEDKAMPVVERFSALVRGKAESLVCHLHGYGTVDLTPEEWECLRTFASFLFQEVEEHGERRRLGAGAS